MRTTSSGAALSLWSAWIMAARPATLTAAVAPVLVGTAVAAHDGEFRPLPFVAALVAASLIQIGTNLANDFFDFEKGVDAPGRLGPSRVTQSGLLSPQEVRIGMYLAFAAAAAVGLYLIVVGGWPILLVGALAISAGIAYTGGPWPLGYHGLGDAFVFLFFGLVAVIGSYYLQVEEIRPLTLAIAVPVGLTVTAILVVNNLRDIETDRRAGKRTLAVRIGAGFTRLQYAILMLAPYLVVSALAVAESRWWFLLPWSTLPVALSLVLVVLTGAKGTKLNGVLKGTAQLHFLFGALLAGSLLP